MVDTGAAVDGTTTATVLSSKAAKGYVKFCWFGQEVGDSGKLRIKQG